MFCKQCGAEVQDTAVVCVKCGSATGKPMVEPGAVSQKSRAAYVLLAIFLGGWGIHNFYGGYTTRAVIQLVVWVVSFLLSFVFIGFFGFLALWIWAIIEACTVTVDSSGQRFA